MESYMGPAETDRARWYVLPKIHIRGVLGRPDISGYNSLKSCISPILANVRFQAMPLLSTIRPQVSCDSSNLEEAWGQWTSCKVRKLLESALFRNAQGWVSRHSSVVALCCVLDHGDHFDQLETEMSFQSEKESDTQDCSNYRRLQFFSARIRLDGSIKLL